MTPVGPGGAGGVAGYLAAHEQPFCRTCWLVRASLGTRPSAILLVQDPDDPSNPIWIVDDCSSCGVRVAYRAIVPVG
jgi:hypothetical protein